MRKKIRMVMTSSGSKNGLDKSWLVVLVYKMLVNGALR